MGEVQQVKTFAEKVRFGGGPRFDPMLEEKGGWVVGEDPRRDEEMVEVVIEVLAQASSHVHEGQLNPFREQVGEILPTNLERNFSGFLVRKDAITFKVDPMKVNARIALLKEQLVIAKFVGPKPTFQDMDQWLQALNQKIGDSVLTFCMNVGKGYFFLKGEDSDALNRALMLSPYKSKWGTCMIQSWVPGFNPDNPSNLAFPTWVALRRLPYEHHDQAIAIAQTLGEVIGIDTSNESARDPRFCVNLMVNKGWVTSIELETEDGSYPAQKVLVDCDKLPMRCKACHSWKHWVRDCNVVQKRPVRGGRRSAHVPQTHQQDKGKSIRIDEDGFQQVINRKNTRRSIFNTINDEMRSNAFALAEESRAARFRSNAQGDVVGQLRGEQTARTNPALRNHDGLGGNKAQDRSTEIQVEGQRSDTTSGDGTLPRTGGEVGQTERVEDLETPVKGRGDPTSTMLWSPRKHA